MRNNTHSSAVEVLIPLLLRVFFRYGIPIEKEAFFYLLQEITTHYKDQKHHSYSSTITGSICM